MSFDDRFPWGNDDLGNLDAPDPGERLNIGFGYETSPLPATYRKRANGLPATATTKSKRRKNTRS